MLPIFLHCKMKCNTMVDPVIAGCIEDGLQRPQIPNHFSVDPKLQ